jgi:peroxiredoxin
MRVSEESRMGKKTYLINGNYYIIDDDTGKIKTVVIQDTPVPQRDMEELIKILARAAENKPGE